MPTIPPALEELIYDEYMRIHRVARIPTRVTDAIDYLNEHTIPYAEKVPTRGIDIERYCFGILCFDTLAHRDKFYRDYPDIASILEEIEETSPFTYRYVNFDILTCCTSVTFEKEGIMIWRYIRGVSKIVAGFFESTLDDWATTTALDVWDEIAPAECAKVGGSVEAVICPDDIERGFTNGIYIISYAESDHKGNITKKHVSDPANRPTIQSGKTVYTGTTTQPIWNRTA